jgi:hypothetical protein
VEEIICAVEHFGKLVVMFLLKLKNPSCLMLLFCMTLSACYKSNLAEINSTHQYSAKELMEEWRIRNASGLYSGRDNDNNYAPYTPPIRGNRNSANRHPVPNYFYDPNADNPQNPHTSGKNLNFLLEPGIGN